MRKRAPTGFRLSSLKKRPVAGVAVKTQNASSGTTHATSKYDIHCGDSKGNTPSLRVVVRVLLLGGVDLGVVSGRVRSRRNAVGLDLGDHSVRPLHDGGDVGTGVRVLLKNLQNNMMSTLRECNVWETFFVLST